MIRNIPFMTIILCVWHGVICAQTENPFQWFARMDTNKDGKLSYQEVPSPLFAQIDLDGDGYVTLDEYKAYLLKEALKELDKDGDGNISQAEFLLLYFDTERYFRDRQVLAQPADGNTLPDSLRDVTDPLGFRFTQDYFSDTRDDAGRLLQGTETSSLAGHHGRLYASFGGNSRDIRTDSVYQGYAIARKDAPGGPWKVDFDIGRTPFRISTMRSVTFTTSSDGVALPARKSLLLAGHWAGTRSLLIRNDALERWEQHPIPTADTSRPGEGFTIRSFGSHTDRVTGVHLLFAGTHTSQQSEYGRWPSTIYSASYDSTVAGGLRWNPDAELGGVGRIMAFVECNGDLYAACGIMDSSLLSGGVFRRNDGPDATWELVYRWKEFDLVNYDDESRIMRGLTAVPNPRNPSRQSLIAYRYYPEPLIERIDPDNGYASTVELRLEEYFGRAWHGAGRYSGPIRCAYNGFTPVRDPASGDTVHIAGLQIYHPRFPDQPHNGSFYLVRRTDGSYRWGEVYDPVHPVTLERRSLDATRFICASPFPDEQGKVWYVGGYDGAFIDNRSAWIYKGFLSGQPSGVEAPVDPAQAFAMYPNPASGSFTIEDAQGPVRVYDLLGRLWWTGLVEGRVNVDMSMWPKGIYMVQSHKAFRKMVKL